MYRIGLDLERWIREEIVETVIAMPVRGGWENDTALLREIVEVAEGTSVKVLAGHANSQGQTSRLTDYAAAGNAYAVGAQGVLYHTYYPNPKRYPYNFETTGRIRFMGYPEIISHMDKTYRLTVAGWPSSIGRFAEVEDQLPIDLSPGEPGREVTLDVSDDIAAKSDAGELWRRIEADPASAATRPNLAGGGLQEVVTMLAQRAPVYRANADLTLDATLPPEELAGRIVAAVRDRQR